jgi:hypothetical protein
MPPPGSTLVVFQRTSNSLLSLKVVVRSLHFLRSGGKTAAERGDGRGSMHVRTLLGMVLMLTTLPIAAREGNRLDIRVTPSVAIAPANLRVRATIEVNRSNRAVEIIAESDNFYRSSEIPLDGDKAPRTTQLEFRGLPGGDYAVRAVLKGAGGVLANARQEVHVVEGVQER